MTISALYKAIEKYSGRVRATHFDCLDQTCQEAAKLIADGRVIAWFRGRMEYGPRALGNRSILADPGHPAMRDRINAMVKMREAFRPFAPACSFEQAHRWFNIAPGTHMPYMITVVDVRPEHRASLPAITHVNGSARLQTVSEQDNPDFHQLLKAVGKTTGGRWCSTPASMSKASQSSTHQKKPSRLSWVPVLNFSFWRTTLLSGSNN